MRPLSLPILCLALFPLLAGCVQTPPALFAYHTDEYHAPPGKKAADVSYDYSSENNQASLNVWHNIANDLINNLEHQYGIVPQTIYLKPHTNLSVFTQSYDHALRTEFTKRGYSISITPEQVPRLFYEAIALENDKICENHKPAYNHTQKADKEISFKITLTLDKDEQAVIKKTYTMLPYGYQDGATYSRYSLSPAVRTVNN